MRKFLVSVLLLCGVAAFGAGPIFLGTTLDYITNSPAGAGSGTITFVYSNRVNIFARRDGSLIGLTNNTSALELRLTLGRTNGQISIPFSLGDNGGGNDASWVIRGTTNNWGLERRDGTTLLQLQQFASAILDASWLPNGTGSYDLGSANSRWRTNWLNVLLAATAVGIGAATPVARLEMDTDGLNLWLATNTVSPGATGLRSNGTFVMWPATNGPDFGGTNIGGFGMRRAVEAFTNDFFIWRSPGGYLFENGSANWLMSVFPHGVNIGNQDTTKSPIARLEVTDTAGNPITSPPSGVSAMITSGSGNSAVRIGQANGSQGRFIWVYNASAASAYMALGVASGSNPLALQDAGGSVGVNGILLPGAALDIAGNSLVSSNSIFTNLVGNFATNGSANTNLTVNFDQAVEDWYPTNNISLTNFAGLDGGKGKSVVKFITPQLVNRTVVYPTLGGASFGSYWYTNDNSFMWTTLTQGVTYALSLTTRGTNVHASITEWK